MYSITETNKETLIKQIEDEIKDILSQFGRVRRASVHYMVARLGLVAAPGEDGRKFQDIIDGMLKKGIISKSTVARGTYLELV